MKQQLPKVLLIAMVAVAWVAGVGMTATQSQSLEDVERHIAENEELKTYKNVLADYDKMISEHPDDIGWYERKADAYFQMEEYKNYVAVCKTIVETFPNDSAGYEKLMTYYDGGRDFKPLLKVYASAPDEVKANEKLKDLYKKYEYTYSYVSGTYAVATPVRNGYGMVQADGYYGFVDASGSLVIECSFDEAAPFVSDAAAVKKGGEWYLIDAEGDRVHASHDAIEQLYSPSEGRTVAKVNGLYGYYTDELADPQHFEYEEATSFFNGVAAVKQGGKWALVDADFKTLTGFDFDEILIDDANVCSRAGLVFAKKDGAFRLYDTAGKEKGSERFDNARLFAGGWAAVEQDGAWGFVNEQGEKAIDCQYEDAQSFNLDIAPVKKDGEWGFVDKDNTMVVQPVLSGATPLSAAGVSSVDAGHGMRYIQFYKYASED